MPGEGKGGLEMRGTTKQHKETFGGDGYIHYLDYGDGFASAYMSKHPIVRFKHVQITVCQSHLKNSLEISMLAPNKMEKYSTKQKGNSGTDTLSSGNQFEAF